MLFEFVEFLVAIANNPFIHKMDQLLDKLISRGTGATLFYPRPLNELPVM